MKKISPLFFILFYSFSLLGQNGPAGIGNSDGSSGQPENVIWFSADSLALSNTNPVAIWNDLSGNGNDATQGAAASRPVFRTGQINGLPAVVFNDVGTQEYMPFDGGLISNSDYTVVFVGRRRSNSSFKVFMAGTGTSTNQNLHIYWNNSTQFRAHHWGNDLQTNMVANTETYSGGTDATEYGIFMTLLASTESTNQRRNYQNNYHLGSRSDARQLSSYNGSAIARFTTNYYDIDAAEIIIYSNALNDAQIQIMYEYLGQKYGITIYNDLFNPITGYFHDMTGIGEEANGEHSESVSAGLYMTALTGLNPGDYVFASHNDSTNSSSTFLTGTEVTNAGADEAYNRIWYIDTVGTPAAQLAFDFSEALEDGLNPVNISNYVLLYRSGESGNFVKVKNADGIKNGDQVYFNLTDTDLNTGYYTLGTEDNINSPLEGSPNRTWYTLVSGNWGDWEIWTLDPSGSLPNNPNKLTPSTSPTKESDHVVILTGRTVVVDTSNNLTHASLKVEGRFDLTTTSNHSFTEISGTGRILMAADNFPSGDASHFYTKGQGEGTVVYYGGTYSLSAAREFFDLEIELDNSSDTVRLLNDYNINGNISIKKGNLKINDQTDDRLINLTVDGNVTVESDGGIYTGTGNPFQTVGYAIGGTLPAEYHSMYHQFTIYGDFTNRGKVRFTNLEAPDYNTLATNGGVTVRFSGATSNSVNLYNTTDFYNLVIDKGTDKTYKINLYSDNTSYFTLFGANNVGRSEAGSYTSQDPQIRKALFVHYGTLQLRGNIYIPTLSEGASNGGNGDYAIGENAKLWIDGENVKVYSTATANSEITGYTATVDGVQTNSSNQAMSLYGEFRITDGIFGTRNSAGFIFWSAAAAQIKIDGGQCDVAQMRDGGSSGVASYIQTGGTVNLWGNENGGEYTGAYPLFGLVGSDAVFHMSGGEIALYDDDGDNDPEFSIESSEGNYKVTGGKLTVNLADTRTAQILSTANLWDVEITNTSNSGSMSVILDTTLRVSNNITINNYCTLDVNDPTYSVDHNVSIGKDFKIIEGATYTFGNNTTTFDGTEDGEFYIGHNTNDGYEQHLWNLTINKTKGKKITVTGDTNKDPLNVSQEYFNRLVQVENDANIISGILDQGRQSVRLFGAVDVKKDAELGVYVAGTTPTTAYIMFRDAGITINSEKGAVFGNIKFNSTGTVTFTNDVYIKRIGYYNGLYNIQSFNLKVDYLHSRGTTTRYAISEGSTSEMIYTSGNASDGGLSILVNSAGTYGFPLGVSGKYTPAEVIVTGYNDDGYITIRPNEGELKTTDPDGGDLLTYYWRVGHEGFSSVPTTEYNFIYNNANIVGNENQYRSGRVLDEDPYTRASENNVTPGSNLINYSADALLKANYTAGVVNRFNGALDIYYSESTGSFNWSNINAWHRNSPTGPNHFPVDGSIVKIMGSVRINVHSASIADLALLEFENTNTSPTSENVGRVQFWVDGTYDLGSVRDTGMISFEANRTINISADFGDFGSTLESYFMYFGGGDNTLTNIPTPIPNLMFESGTKRIGEDISIGQDFLLNGWCNVYLENDMDIARDMVVGVWGAGDIRFSGTGSAVTVDVGRNIDFSQENNSNDRDLIVDNGGDGTIEHRLIVKGDIIHSDQNDNTIDFYNGDDRTKVVVEFQGDTTQKYYRTSTSVPDFYRLVVNKGTSASDTIVFEDNFNIHGTTLGATKAIELQNGVLKLDDPNINIDLSSGTGDFEIPSTASLHVKQGTVNVYGDNTGIWLDGKLLVDGGTVDMINGAGNGNNYIEYSSSGNSKIVVSSGNLWVGSQIRRNTITEEGILSYNQSGGNVQVGVNAGGDNERGIFEILNTESSFRHSDGEFFIVNDYRSGASIASMYFDPDTVNLSTGTEIKFGDTLTTAGNSDFSLYAGKSLMNLTVDSINSPKLTLDVVLLSLDEDLTIKTTSEFDANGLDLYVGGDFINRETFTANQNNTYFNGADAQQIKGATTFWNLHKTTTNTLTIRSNIDVDNELHLDAGTFNDGDSTLSVQGNVWMDITHNWGGTSNGILMNGSEQQVVIGDGTYGKLSINNSAGIFLPQGNEVTIEGALQLENGVLDIGKNLFILNSDAIIIEQNPFSENNMIQTNISFTDAGVKKYYPLIEPADNYSFIYPIGSEGKYTPIELDIDSINAGGYIRVKAANEMHPTIVNDTEPCNEIHDTANVLKYHWLMEANSVLGFNAEARMSYYLDDYQETSTYYDVTHYIAARLLWGSTQWNKYDQASFDETNLKLRFSFSNADTEGISGDYTAGVEDQTGTCEGAIPDEVPAYVTTTNGEWTDASIWDTYPTGGGTVPSGGPRGAIAIVKDTVTIPKNYILSYKTTIDTLGMVKVGSTFGHRLGIVEGTGTLQLENGSLPAGIYDDFFSRSGGTIEFTGTDDYDVLSEVNNVRNIKYTGTGQRRLPNLDFEVYGQFTIDGSDGDLWVINEHDRNMILDSSIVFNTGKFDAGSDPSTVTFGGTDEQIISGTGSFTGSNAFMNVILNNANGVSLSSPIEVDGTLNFNSGIFRTTSTNILTVDNALETAVSGYSTARYVDGPMRKLINTGGSFIFPVGDAGRYGRVEAISTATSSTDYWEAEYYNADPSDHSPAMDTANRDTDLEMVSGNEYWRLEGPVGDSAKVKIRWDSQSLLPAMTSDRSGNLKLVEYITDKWVVVPGAVSDGGINSGTIVSNFRVDLDENFFTLGTYEQAPLPTAGFTSPDTSICAGDNATLRVTLTGTAPWTLKIDSAGSIWTHTVNSSPYSFTTNPVGSTTYTITEVTDATPTTSTTTIFGSPVAVTIVALPTPTITPSEAVQTFCEGDITNYSVTNNLGNTYTWAATGGNVVSGQGSSSVSVEWLTNPGTISVTESTSQGCDGTDNITPVTVHSIPDANDQTPAALCSETAGDDVQYTGLNLTANHTAINNQGGVIYSWFNDAALSSPVATPASTNIVDTFGGAISYTKIYYCQVDNGNCTDVATVTYTIYRIPSTGPQYHIPNTIGL